MAELANFAARVQQQLASAGRQPHWEPGEAEAYMAAVSGRRAQFERVAEQLTVTVVRPRLETLAAHFPNASPGRNEPTGHCTWWFGFCDRFPTSTRVAITIEHDIRVEHVSVRFDVDMVPLLIKFDQHDKLTIPVDNVSEAAVADWIERRLLEFLDAYLRIDRGGEDLDQDSVVDPVCGMRIERRSASTFSSYKGHSFYFCSQACREKFDTAPAVYARVKTL